MSNLVIEQSQYYSSDVCMKAIHKIEQKYEYIDESDYFSGLVNFSTAKSEPYQRWVRYREGYSTVLVNELLQRANVNPNTHYVADPMVGSGSTIIAAKNAGYDAFGVDVNPYCKILVEAKLLSPGESTIQRVEAFSHSFEDRVKDYNGELPPLSEYFPQKNLYDLLALKALIDDEADANTKDVIKACWFFILESCSNRKKDGNGLATRPAPITNVFEFFKNTLDTLVEDYRQHPFSDSSTSSIFTGSAKNFLSFNEKFEKQSGKKLGAVVFSPPYANAFNYFESYKMELLFGKLYTQEEYQIHKKEQIRNYRISQGKEKHSDYAVVELLCDEINSAIPKKETTTGKRDSRTRLMPNMLRGYFNDMGVVLEQLYLSLDDNGECFIVVDQSAYVGVIVPTDIILAAIGEEKGFSVEKIIICRKAATSSQQRKVYPYLGNTLRESIVCLKKINHC